MNKPITDAEFQIMWEKEKQELDALMNELEELLYNTKEDENN